MGFSRQEYWSGVPQQWPPYPLALWFSPNEWTYRPRLDTWARSPPPYYSCHHMPPLSATARGLLYHGIVGSLLLFRADHSVPFLTATVLSRLLVADGALPAACSHFLPRHFEKKDLFHNWFVLFPGESCSAIFRVSSSESAVVCWVARACSSLHC